MISLVLHHLMVLEELACLPCHHRDVALNHPLVVLHHLMALEELACLPYHHHDVALSHPLVALRQNQKALVVLVCHYDQSVISLVLVEDSLQVLAE